MGSKGNLILRSVNRFIYLSIYFLELGFCKSKFDFFFFKKKSVNHLDLGWQLAESNSNISVLKIELV